MRTLFQLSRFHIICIAAVTSLTFGWLLTGHDLWIAVAVCALDWFLVNLMNRVADLAEDRKNGVGGTAFVARHERALTIGAVALLVASFPITHLVAPRLTPWRLLFEAIGLAYNYRVIPSLSGLTRFKETYLVKNTSSAALFLISCLAYPAALAGSPLPWARLLWLAAFFFPLELTYEIIYDLRDVEGDRAERVPTFPVEHGLATSHRIIESLLLISAAALVAGYLSGSLRFRELVLIFGVVQQALFFELRIKRRVTQLDCIFLTYIGAAQVLSYNVWVWSGLPLGR